MEKKRAEQLNQCGSRTSALLVKCSSNIRNVDGVLLYNELWREANSIYEKWAKCRGISYCELLFCLSLEEGICRQKDICRQWALAKQTVNTILKNFMARGFVSLVPSGDDRRNKEIVLTKSGREFVGEIAGSLHEYEHRVWEKMGLEKTKALLEYTALYNQLFQEEIL